MIDGFVKEPCLAQAETLLVLVAERGELTQEAVVGAHPAPREHVAQRRGGAHAPPQHQVRHHHRGGARHALHAVHQYLACNTTQTEVGGHFTSQPAHLPGPERRP